MPRPKRASSLRRWRSGWSHVRSGDAPCPGLSCPALPCPVCPGPACPAPSHPQARPRPARRFPDTHARHLRFGAPRPRGDPLLQGYANDATLAKPRHYASLQLLEHAPYTLPTGRWRRSMCGCLTATQKARGGTRTPHLAVRWTDRQPGQAGERVKSYRKYSYGAVPAARALTCWQQAAH
jgi:hypothetical protein